MAVRSATLGLCAAALAVGPPAVAFAGAGLIQIDGVKTITVQPITRRGSGNSPADILTSKATRVEIGKALPIRYTMLVGSARLGLPQPRDGWVYFLVGTDIYRVDLNSREVLEKVPLPRHRTR